MGIPQCDEWVKNHVKKLAAQHPESGVKTTDTDVQAILKVLRATGEAAKALPGKVKDPDAFIETSVDLSEKVLRNLWVVPAAYYVAFREAGTALLGNGDAAGIIDAIQSVIKGEEPDKPSKPAPKK